MENITRLLLPDVAAALRTDPGSVVELTDELHPADLADLAAVLNDDLATLLLRTLPVADTARVLEAMDRGRRLELFTQLVAADLAATADLAEAMAPDERADLFGALSEEVRGSLLARMERAESRDVRQLLTYPEGTAGSLMTTSFVALPGSTTVARAIEHVRKSAAEMETIYAAYAIDPNGTLLGVVSLRDLVVARGERTIEDIMEAHVISVDVNADQEEVARLIAKYDLLAIPVTDRAKVVGIITVDDVVDVLQDEATEDVQKLGAVQPLEDTYFQTRFGEFVRKRAAWLVILFGGELLTGSAMRYYTGTFEQMLSLIWFVPLIISSGGNAGSQSASLMIRALAINEVRPADFVRVITRELSIGLALGVVLSVVGIVRVVLWNDTRSLEMGCTIALALTAVVTLGAVVGSGLPLLLKRAGADPAVSSTPFIASLVDVLGLVMYFEIARFFLF